ncbi:hypothetical protein PMZ80_003181 [Knufia obscura]|uniref:Uncharacterized protein n=1 Tax=Knufia obscura TaxID=1635080 RepID=A0ABR0RTH9_9EURO|nr:hypothetical protein PMZ80_003181 [Knufia obscura]
MTNSTMNAASEVSSTDENTASSREPLVRYRGGHLAPPIPAILICPRTDLDGSAAFAVQAAAEEAQYLEEAGLYGYPLVASQAATNANGMSQSSSKAYSNPVKSFNTASYQPYKHNSTSDTSITTIKQPVTSTAQTSVSSPAQLCFPLDSPVLQKTLKHNQARENSLKHLAPSQGMDLFADIPQLDSRGHPPPASGPPISRGDIETVMGYGGDKPTSEYDREDNHGSND